jgi:DNA-binding MarR family transcriptional regulator
VGEGDVNVEGRRVPDEAEVPPIAVLLRRPALTVRHRVMAALRAAGYGDILPAHLGVFQHPGPDGQRPGVLAARTHASKQAMNHLLHQLETGGYLVREPHPDDRRTRVVRLTDRGWAALRAIREAALEVEEAWAEGLGRKTYLEVRRGLDRLERLLDASSTSIPEQAEPEPSPAPAGDPRTDRVQSPA